MFDDRESDEALGNFLLMLRTRGYRSQPLLNAVERAPRTEFVALEHVGFAYLNMSLPLPCGQETGRPLAVIEAVAALGVEPGHNVLEIGTGSGWQTALIAGMARAVASMERFETLAEAADERLERLGCRNAVVIHGDGAEGLEDAAPFDRIVMNAAVFEPPKALARQLREGGVMVAPLRGRSGVRLTRLVKAGGTLQREELSVSDLPPLLQGVARNI